MKAFQLKSVDFKVNPNLAAEPAPTLSTEVNNSFHRSQCTGYALTDTHKNSKTIKHVFITKMNVQVIACHTRPRIAMLC